MNRCLQWQGDKGLTVLVVAFIMFSWSVARYLAANYWPDAPADATNDPVDDDTPAARPWTPPALDTVVDLPDRGPVAATAPAEPEPDPEPVPVEPVDLVDPIRVDAAEPPAECSDQWWDERSCWGCDKACRFRDFHPYGRTNIGAEIRGAAGARARADRESTGLYHSGFAQESRKGSGSDKRALWDQWCERCGTLAREWVPRSDPSVVDGLDVAVEGSPF